METENIEIEIINRKYEELISRAFNDTEHINIDDLFNEVLPRLKKAREKEIELIKNKKN